MEVSATSGLRSHEGKRSHRGLAAMSFPSTWLHQPRGASREILSNGVQFCCTSLSHLQTPIPHTITLQESAVPYSTDNFLHFTMQRLASRCFQGVSPRVSAALLTTFRITPHPLLTEATATSEPLLS